MLINIWLVLEDQAQDIVIESLRWDEETQGEYTGPLRPRSRRLFEYMQDDAARRRLFKPWTNAQGTFHLWSITFDDRKAVLQEIRDEILYLIDQYPDRIQIVGAWKGDGAMVGCQLVLTEVPNPDYVGEPFEIPNPDYQPDPELPDYDPRETIRNPAWVPETIIERSQTGTPTFPIPTWLWRFMPDSAGATSNADLTDVNVLYGQSPRVFS